MSFLSARLAKFRNAGLPNRRFGQLWVAAALTCLGGLGAAGVWCWSVEAEEAEEQAFLITQLVSEHAAQVFRSTPAPLDKADATSDHAAQIRNVRVYLEGFYARAGSSWDGRLVLLRRDLSVIARYPPLPPGAPRPGSPRLRQSVEHEIRELTASPGGPPRQIDPFGAIAQAGDLPIFVIYMTEAAQVWRRWALQMIPSAIGALVGFAFLSWMIRRAQRQTFQEHAGMNARMVLAIEAEVSAKQQLEVQKRLTETQAALLKAARLGAAGAMASGLAHQINQPLAAVSNFLRASSRLITKGMATGDQAALQRADEGIQQAIKQVVRAGEVVTRFRRFITDNTLETTSEAAGPLVREACVLGLERHPDVVLQVHEAPELSPVLVDRIQVQEAIINLVRNAAEAMSNSLRKELTIVIAPSSSSGVEIVVSDTGPGFGPGKDTIFDTMSSTKSDGMGMGLAIARTIVQAHGGSIQAEGNADGGATVRITLPGVP